jgi:hypothetical protein
METVSSPPDTGSRKGKLSILTANVSCGERCWSPVLPGIETEEDWQARLAAVTASLKPASYLEEQLAYQAALSLQQWDRLHRYERAQIAHQMREALDDPFGEHTDSARTVMEMGVAALKAQSAPTKGESLLRRNRAGGPNGQFLPKSSV